MDNLPSINELIEMAKTNPELLDKIQKEETKKIIDNASSEDSKRRLNGLSFKIEAIKRKNGNNHMKTAMELNKLMENSRQELSNKIIQHFKKETPQKARLKIVKKD